MDYTIKIVGKAIQKRSVINNIRILTQCNTECRIKTVSIYAKFTLLYNRLFVFKNIFDRVFDRNDVARMFLIDHFYQCRKCCCFAASGSSCHQNQTTAKVNQFL